VTRTTSSNDDVTDKRLSLLISLVVVGGGLVVAWAAVTAWSAPAKPPSPQLLIGIIAAITVGSRTAWRIRIRSHGRGISWPEVGVLVGLTVAPPAWVILCTCVAITIAKVTARYPRQKAIFGVAKEVLVASAACAVFVALDIRPNADKPNLHLLALVLATVAMWIVDESLIVPVIALATRSGIGAALRANWDMRVVGLLARYTVTVLIVGILDFDGDTKLLLLVAPVVLCIHLWQTGQIRNREERKSWQRLAQSTDELNVVDLDAVLHSAVTRAAELFSADEADIELRLGGADRLVSGTAAEVGKN